MSILWLGVGALLLLVGEVQCWKKNPHWKPDPNWRPYANDSFIIPPVNLKVARAFYEDAVVYGLPSTDNLKLSENYILSYDRRLKHPVWVLEHLTGDQMRQQKGDRKLCWFKADETIHEYFRSTNDDYMASGYDRGHMSPASDNMAEQRIMDQSFSLSNTAPQLPGLNRGAWVRLERYIQHSARKSKNIYIVTGAVYLPVKTKNGFEVRYKVIGRNKVAVPTHFYKVWLREDDSAKLYLEAFLMPNSFNVTKETPLEKFRFDVGKLPVIERAAGVIFFDKLNRNKVIKPTKLQCGYVDEKILFKDDSENKASSP